MASLTIKQQHWSEQLQRAEAFGGTIADYARQQGIPAQDLYRWRNLLRKREITQSSSQTVFTEVTQSSFSGPCLTLHLGKAQMVFQSLPQAQWLASLIAAHE